MAENIPKRSQAEKGATEKENNIEIDAAKVILLETTKLNLIHQIASNLEISELGEDTEEQTDDFVDKVKEIIQELIDEFNERLDPDKEKGQFVKAIIKIFSILLNTKANLVEKIKK